MWAEIRFGGDDIITMDFDKLIEKLMKWLSDPKWREMAKTFLYLIFPLLVLVILRRATRRRPTEKTSSALKPKLRPSTTEKIFAI